MGLLTAPLWELARSRTDLKFTFQLAARYTLIVPINPNNQGGNLIITSKFSPRKSSAYPNLRVITLQRTMYGCAEFFFLILRPTPAAYQAVADSYFRVYQDGA